MEIKWPFLLGMLIDPTGMGHTFLGLSFRSGRSEAQPLPRSCSSADGPRAPSQHLGSLQHGPE